MLSESLQNLKNSKVQLYCTQNNIKCNFNPPAASHMRGAWERMIRFIRKILQSILWKNTLNDEGCLTFIAQVEAIINSRPLVPVSYFVISQEPLTSNHLLLLRGNPNFPPSFFSEDDCCSKRRWAQIQFFANQFWRRWMSLYPICSTNKMV